MTISQAIQPFLDRVTGRNGTYVGFSGGSDSTALLLALVEAGVTVTAVHFQHGIRGQEAEDDADWCEGFCLKRNLPFIRINLHVPDRRLRGETTEEAARRLRLQQWMRLAQNACVFLAHHGDDVLEELFLRLARGANASGLTGLRPVRIIRGVTFIRPFLQLTKPQLQDYIQARGIRDWRLDATNNLNDCRRNAVRNQLLPMIRSIFTTDAGFRQAIWALRQDADHLENEARSLAGTRLTKRDWQRLSPALLPRVFRLWRQQQDGRDEPPPKNFIDALATALQDHRRTIPALQVDPTHRLTIRPDGLHWEHSTPAKPFCYCWNWLRHPTILIPEAHLKLTVSEREADDGACAERFASAHLTPTLTVRSWQPGDRMVPFGHHTPKKLQDLLTDAHLSHDQKQVTAILCAGPDIIWIPFVRRAEYARTAPGTRTVTITAMRTPAET